MQNLIRILVLAGAALVVALLFSLGLVKALDVAEIKTPRTTLDVLAAFQFRLQKVKGAHGIAYLGDSTGLSSKGRKYAIPGRLDELLKGIGGMPPVISLAEAGLGPMDFYLLASEVAEVRPAAVVVSLNFGALSEIWLGRSSHPEFASVIGTNRWLEAFGLPLVVGGVKADRLVLYPLLKELGLAKTWQTLARYQARVLEGWRRAEKRLDGERGPYSRYMTAAGAARSASPLETKAETSERLLRQQQQNRYGKAVSGMDPQDPSLRMLSAALRYWKTLDVPVLLVVIPVNVELFQSLGIADQEGTARTLAALAEMAQSMDAEFLDLHDLLPEEAFADPHGHYSITAAQDGPSLIAARIAPVLVSMVGTDR